MSFWEEKFVIHSVYKFKHVSQLGDIKWEFTAALVKLYYLLPSKVIETI